ncbi:MAG: DUF2283 domain-containing protein [Proteobacteria bacterium]|jgi:uncharacterized protein YuzE|nr:DUF2283 domain-containing protein [Pseudomonadota bacterium]
MEIMKDNALDVAYIRLRNGKVKQTVEVRPGVLMDLDQAGEVVGIEILSVSKLAPKLVATTRKKKRA